MLRLLKRNPLRRQRIPLHQISQNHLDPIFNGVAANTQNALSPCTVFFYFFSSTSNLGQESPKTKETILNFFLSYGFTDTQIKRFIHKCQSVQSTVALKPKIEHLLAFGFSPSGLVWTICYGRKILPVSLKERIVPNLKLLEATFGSKTRIIKAINHGPWLLLINLEKSLIPNVKLLRENSIPVDKITYLFTTYPTVLIKDPNLIIETISKLKGLGMSPLTLAFVHGMNAMVVFKKETWERKIELYRSFGWPEEDILSVFSRHPNCMQLSDDKIKKKMNFFNEKLHWDSTMVLRQPVVLTYSLEKRIIPYCAVLSVLFKNEFWRGKPMLFCLLTMAEKRFRERFVDKYQKEVPQVIDAYQGKIDFVGFESNVAGSLKL